MVYGFMHYIEYGQNTIVENLKMKKVLICGDSFCVTDPSFPNLHWSEKLLNNHADIEIINLAIGGSSNSMIAMQLLHGLQFKPDFVIISFTCSFRFEIEVDSTRVPFDINKPECILEYLSSRYKNANVGEQIMRPVTNFLDTVGDNTEMFRNYLHASFCLDTLNTRNIDFCYSIGGLQVIDDIQNFLKKQFLADNLYRYQQNELSVNLWNHNDGPTAPYFHVGDDAVHNLFANECESKIWKN